MRWWWLFSYQCVGHSSISSQSVRLSSQFVIIRFNFDLINDFWNFLSLFIYTSSFVIFFYLPRLIELSERLADCLLLSFRHSFFVSFSLALEWLCEREILSKRLKRFCERRQPSRFKGMPGTNYDDPKVNRFWFESFKCFLLFFCDVNIYLRSQWTGETFQIYLHFL